MKIKIIAFLLTLTLIPTSGFAESTYDRVVRTGVIKCGYMLWPPYFDRDVNTKKFSGMNYDYVEALGSNLNLKIDWAMEINLGDQVESLRSGKIDAICGSEGPVMPSTTKYLTYSTPMIYVPFYLYARNGDSRFDKDTYNAINQNDIRISSIDGDVSGQTARILFPKVKTVSIPQLGTPNQMMMDVEGKKADIVINEPLSMYEYCKHNKNALKKINSNLPVVIIPNTLSFLTNNESLTFINMMNQAIENLKNSGEEVIILTPYLKIPSGETSFYQTAQPYTE